MPDIKKSEKAKKPKFDPAQPYTEVDQEELEPSTFEKIINVIDIPGSVGRTAIEAGLSPEREVIPEVTRQIEAIKERPTTAAMEAPSEYDVFRELVGKPEPKSPEEIAISDKDWKEIIGYFEKINLEKLPTLKDPTQKRFYDGAAIANLKVRYQDKNYETTDFDHEFPPAEIEKLVNKLVSLAKEKE